MYVSTSTLGQGLGSRLMSELITASEKDGIWTLQSAVFPENEASINAHRKHGFRVVGKREKLAKMTHGPKAGTWRDVVLLERRSQVAGDRLTDVTPHASLLSWLACQGESEIISRQIHHGGPHGHATKSDEQTKEQQRHEARADFRFRRSGSATLPQLVMRSPEKTRIVAASPINQLMASKRTSGFCHNPSCPDCLRLSGGTRSVIGMGLG